MGKTVPVKQDLNLAQREIRHRDLGSAALLAVVLAVGVALFCKFAVIDQLDKASQASDLADRAEEQLFQAQALNQDYNQVLEAYQETALVRGSMGSEADAMESLDLIEEMLISRARVSSFTVADGLIGVQLSGVTLQEVSSIYAALMAQELVEAVQVYTAADQGDPDTQVSAAMTIQLAGAAEEEAAS